MFNYTTTIKLRDADVGGVLFFGRYFALAHDAFEAFLTARGLSMARIFNEEAFVIAVVHAEANYRRPLPMGEEVTVRISVQERRTRSFTMQYELSTEAGDVACVIQTVHAVVDKARRRAVPLPEIVVRTLEDA